MTYYERCDKTFYIQLLLVLATCSGGDDGGQFAGNAKNLQLHSL